jgi:hypothetical protein
MRSILENNYGFVEPRKEDHNAAEIAKLAGQVRALEAVLLEIPEVTPDRIRTAKESLRARYRNSYNPRRREAAMLLDKIKAPYDEHAEAALEALAGIAANRPGSPAVASKGQPVVKQPAPELEIQSMPACLFDDWN